MHLALRPRFTSILFNAQILQILLGESQLTPGSGHAENVARTDDDLCLICCCGWAWTKLSSSRHL